VPYWWTDTHGELSKEPLAKVSFHRDFIKLPQGIWWHRLPACADKGLNLKDITLIFFHKDHLGKLRVINAASTFNTLLDRLESLCHQPEMNFEDAS
jgi:hypothetical protein